MTFDALVITSETATPPVDGHATLSRPAIATLQVPVAALNPKRALFEDSANASAALLSVPVDEALELATTMLHALVTVSETVVPPVVANAIRAKLLTLNENLPDESTPKLVPVDVGAPVNEMTLSVIVA
jgi:hypothetical protein